MAFSWSCVCTVLSWVVTHPEAKIRVKDGWILRTWNHQPHRRTGLVNILGKCCEKKKRSKTKNKLKKHLGFT